MEVNNAHITKLSMKDLASKFAVPLVGESHEDHLDRVVSQLGITAFKTFCSRVGVGGMTKGEKNDPKGAVVHELVARGVFNNLEIISIIANTAVARSSKPANYNDVFDRVANVGIQQELVFFGGKLDNSENSVKVAEFLDSTKHSLKPAVVSALEQKFVVVASVENKVVGIATTLDGNLDYSKNGDGLKPVEVVSHGPGLSRLADILSLSVYIKGDDIALVNPTEGYIAAGQLTRLFKQPKMVLNTCGGLVIDLFTKFKHTQPSVTGTGLQLQKWMYDFLRYVFAVGQPVLKNFEMFAKIWNSNIVAKGGLSLQFQLSGTAIVCGFASPPYSMAKTFDGVALVKDNKSNFEAARDSLLNRRRTETTGSSGISGLTLGYAVGVNFPARVLDVLCIAADIGPFVKGKKAISLNVTGGNKLEAMLRALVYLKYQGDVWCSDYKAALKLAQSNDVNKGTKSAVSSYAREFRFGKSDFKLIGKPPAKDIPAIYYDIYSFNRKFKDYDEYTSYCIKVRGKIHELIESDVYLLNVPLVEGMEGDGVYQSFEPHNMWGWETNDPGLMTRLCEFTNTQENFYKKPYSVGFFIQPFNAATKGYAYARTVIANVSRAQYPFTGFNFYAVCEKERIIAKGPPPGNLSGILSDKIMINGMAIENVVADASLMATLSSEGSEEVKQLLKIHVVGARKEKKEKEKVEEDKEEKSEDEDDDEEGSTREVIVQKVVFDDV